MNVITNTFIVQNPEITNVRNILKERIKNHHYRFIQFAVKCKWELCFSDNSYFHNITFNHYLEIPKPRVEMSLNKKYITTLN